VVVFRFQERVLGLMMKFPSFVLFLPLLGMLCGVPVLAQAGGHGGGEAKKPEPKGNKNENASITGGQQAGDPVYLHLAPITLPIITDYGAQQIVTMLIDLNTKDTPTAEEMKKQMPKLKDALLQSLYGSLADGSVRNAQALDIVKIKAKIMETLNTVYEEGAVKDVFVQAVSQRKL